MVILFGLLAVVTSIASLAGLIWLVVVAFKESTTWGFVVLSSLCCCLGGLVFAIKHWEDAKKPFALWVGCWLLSLPCSVVVQLDAQKEFMNQWKAAQNAQLEQSRLNRGNSSGFEDVEDADLSSEPDTPRNPGTANSDWAQAEEAKKAEEAKRPKVIITEAGLLTQVRGTPDDRLIALKEWRKAGFDQTPGGRKKMLTALSLPLEPHIRKIVLASLSEWPLKTDEALDCLSSLALPEALRTPILKGLFDAGESDPERVAEIVNDVEETGSLLVEELLVRMRHPRPGALGRLLTNRGHEWAKSKPGIKVLEILAQDTTELEPLLKSEREDLRGLGCDLAAKGKDPKAALKILVALLKDEVPSVRQRAAVAIEARNDSSVTWYLALAIVRETDDGVRTVLVRSLRSLPLDKTVNYLRKLYKKKNPKARIAAVEGARALRSYSATQIMLRALHDKDNAVLIKALEALQAVASDDKLKLSANPGLRNLQILTFDPGRSKEVNRLAKRVYYSLTGRIPKRPS